MHYYKRNLGDYAKKAGRLTMLQHGAYTLLIDACYDRERFPTRDDAIDWAWASTTAEIEAVDFVLSRFFVLGDDGEFVQDRILQEILDYHEKSDTNKRIANEREARRKEKLTNRERTVNEPPPNQEPRTKNQEPLENLMSVTDITNCPHVKIIEAYNSTLATLGMTAVKPKLWDGQRKTNLAARWREDPERQSVGWWQGLFDHIATSRWLTGQNPESKGWSADLGWIVNKSNLIKILEGKYDG